MKYNVIVNIDIYVDDVEAETKEEAIMIAKTEFYECFDTAEIQQILIDKESK